MPGTSDGAWSRLTGAIVQLQTSIDAYKSCGESSAQLKLLDIGSNGYPIQRDGSSFIPPTEQTAASPTTRAGLDLLKSQLAYFEHQLRQRGQWRLPSLFSPDPVLLLDLSDLEDAIQHLTIAVDSPRFPQPEESAYARFCTKRWEWNFQWYEWYYVDLKSGNHVFLDEWEREDEFGDWFLIEQGHRSVEEGLDALGSWEDWRWDEEWGEWYLPLVVDDTAVVRKAIYAGEWHKNEEENWLYVEPRVTS